MKLLGLHIGRTEDRSASLDVGRVYASFFQFGASQYSWQVSPAVLAGNITQDGEQSLIEHSRRLSRQSPILRAYKRAMVGGILTGEPERPHFDEGVPDAVISEVSRLISGWLSTIAIWSGLRCTASLSMATCSSSMTALWCLLTNSPRQETGPDWNRTVSGFKIGKGIALAS